MPLFHRIDTVDPWHNLAVERAMFHDFAGHALLLWRNAPCVVMGRHQNPWVECDLGLMAANSVPLVRRTSGGGAVYHDPGNTNFTFFGTSETYDLDRHFGVVIAGLESLGIPVTRNARNDLVVGDRKFSGNAFRHTRGRSLHHGTLLVSADLDKLTAYLTAPASTPGGPLVSSKAIGSVRSRVVNLSEFREDLTHALLADALRRAYLAEFVGADAAADGQESGIREGLHAHHTGSEQLAAYEREFKSWEWRFGKTPTFTLRAGPGFGEAALSEPRPNPGPRGRPAVNVTITRGEIVSVDPVAGVSDTGAQSGTSVSDGIAPLLNRELRGVRFAYDEIMRRAGELDPAAAGSVSDLIEEIAVLAGRPDRL